MTMESPARMPCRSGRRRRRRHRSGPLGGALLAVAVLAGLCQRSAPFPLRPPQPLSRSHGGHAGRWGRSCGPVLAGRQPAVAAATALGATAATDGGGAARVATHQTPRLLLVDHYDSFTYNLVDLLAQLGGAPPEVVAWDALARWREDEADPGHNRSGFVDGYDGIVLSPGPGAPADYPASLRLVEAAAAAGVPLLGVCLGHQMVGLAHGATVCRAPEPVHGRVWECRLVEDADKAADWDDADTQTSRPVFLSRLFRDVPRRFHATRYHSLQVVVPPSPPGETPLLRVTATTVPAHGGGTKDGTVVMALESTVAPQYGVQFHPESIGSIAVGRALLQNFLDIVRDCRRRRLAKTLSTANKSVLATDFSQSTVSGAAAVISRQEQQRSSRYNETVVYVSRLDNFSVHWTPEQVMQRLYRHEPFAYWLDSATAPLTMPGAHVHNDKPDFQEDTVSILGAARERVEYWVNMEGNSRSSRTDRRIIEYIGNHSQKVTSGQDIFEFLMNEFPVHARTDSITMVDWDSPTCNEPVMSVHLEQEHPLPFAFRGGHVGYLGYECRFDTHRHLQEIEGSLGRASTQETRAMTSSAHIPTAAFMMARQNCVFHHATSTWYLVGVGRNQQEKLEVLDWMRRTKHLLTSHTHMTGNVERRHDAKLIPPSGLKFIPNRSRATYMRNFEICMELISSGESYELCLTNQLEALLPDREKSPLELYSILRARNPAPHAAYLHWNLGQSDSSTLGSFAICCSSPERFLSVKRTANGTLVAETKPIKGTRARVLPLNDGRRSMEEEQNDSERARDLQASVKDRAENLMIVDLLRNDFSRVCDTGSVHVSKLMDIESYATVHQMVSTIRGQLDPSKSTAIDLLKACFPGGSMTGAPKIRTMELLNRLEEGVVRGPYSGCLGYISMNGCVDMNIIIRTAILAPHQLHGLKVSVGSGGAITALSANIDEYDEMLLKAFPVTEAVREWATSREHGAVLTSRSYNFTSNKSSVFG